MCRTSLHAALATFSLVLACAEPRGLTLDPPARIRRALTMVDDLSARAELTANGGARLAAVELVRGGDGATFSGFIEAAPGEYRLDVVFSGLPLGAAERAFLGRWRSNVFTVTRGSVAEPTFDEPLDTIGLPEDRGDEDGDGLGLLDEHLWGADPARADSDGDDLADGADCDPADAAKRFAIVEGGTIEDCDGDLVRRPDLPYGTPGTDCNDRDGSIHPGAEDVCTDTVDQDCNPATCPVDDREAPMIDGVAPEDGARVGCHRRLSARVTEQGVLASVVGVFDPGLATEAMLWLTEEGAGTYVSLPFGILSGLNGVAPGPHALEIRANDVSNNRASKSVTYQFDLDLPQVTRMTPDSVGARSTPFTVEIEAIAAFGVASIELFASAKTAQGLYQLTGATSLGRVAAARAAFEIDPAAFSEGEYLLFNVVEDQVGNRSTPSDAIFPIAGSAGVEVDVDFRCIQSPNARRAPARVLVVGGDHYTPVMMRAHLEEARQLARAEDPGAALVSIMGLGVGADGKVALDDASSYSKRWTYMFRNAATARAITVTWLTPAYTTQNPVVDPDAGNVVAEEPIADADALLDSDAVVRAAIASPGCRAPVGHDNDSVLYQSTGGAARVFVTTNAGTTWQGTATDPITTTIACQ